MENCQEGKLHLQKKDQSGIAQTRIQSSSSIVYFSNSKAQCIMCRKIKYIR